MKVLYLGFVSPEEVFAEVLKSDIRMPVQTQRFGWNLINALKLAGVEVDVVSAVPASDFPKNSKVYFTGRSFTEDGVEGSLVGFVNLLGLKHWTRAWGMGRVLKRRYDARGTRPDVVIVHGVNSAVLGVGRAASRRWGIPCVVVLTDPPHGMSSREERPTSLPRRIDYASVLEELGSYDGAVALTDELAQEFLPGRPYLLMEALVDIEALSSGSAERSEHRVDVLYAGGVDPTYGTTTLVDAVQHSQGNWTLGVCGRGPGVDAVLAAQGGSSRVRYLGVLTASELASAYAHAKVLANPRPPLDFTRFSFPSKLIEYLAQGNIVASTRLPGIPAEYWEHLVELPADAEGMATVLDRLTLLGDDVLSLKRDQSREFVRLNKSLLTQGRRVREFLGRLAP